MSKKLEDYTLEQQNQILQELLIMQNGSNLHLQEVVKGQDQEIATLTAKVKVLERRVKRLNKDKRNKL